MPCPTYLETVQAKIAKGEEKNMKAIIAFGNA